LGSLRFFLIINIFLLFSCISFNAFSETRLELGEGITLLIVNGKKVESESLFSGNPFIKLPKGQNQILVNYTAEINPGDDSELEVTQPTVILFNSQAQTLRLTAPVIKTARDVEKFEKNMSWNLIDNNGNKIPFKSDLLIKKGFQLSRNYEDELEEFNTRNNSAALQKKDIISKKTNINHTEQQTQVNKNKKIAMDMLIYWYNQADDKTRRSFKELISK